MFGQHARGGDKFLVIIDDALKSGDLTDRTQGPPADLSDALRNCIGCSEYLLTLLIEKQVIVAKMRPRHMPMEILRLEVEGEQISQEASQGVRHFRDGMGFKRRRHRRRSALSMIYFSSVHRLMLLSGD